MTTKDIIKRCGGLFRYIPGRLPKETVRSLNGGKERKTVIRVDTSLAQKEAGINESSAKRGIRAGPQTPISGGSPRSGQGVASTDSSPSVREL